MNHNETVPATTFRTTIILAMVALLTACDPMPQQTVSHECTRLGYPSSRVIWNTNDENAVQYGNGSYSAYCANNVETVPLKKLQAKERNNL